MAKSFCGYPIDDGDDFLLQDIPRKYVFLKNKCIMCNILHSKNVSISNIINSVFRDTLECINEITLKHEIR